MTRNYQNTDRLRALDGNELSVELPDEVTISLAEVADSVREGLLAVVVSGGMQLISAVLDENVTGLCGPRGKHDPDRTAKRHGSEDGSVALGGRRAHIRRPRVRTADGEREVPVAAYDLFTNTDMLGELTFERVLAGLATRRYGVGLEPVGSQVEARASATSKSAVSRRFVALSAQKLAEFLDRDLSEIDPAAIMIDGVNFAEHLCVVVLVIDTDGNKHPVGLREGSTENATLVTDLLAALRDRGLDVTKPVLFVIDGAKALPPAIRSVFDHPVIQRCQEHKIRNVCRYLPKREQSNITAKMRSAYADPDHHAALGALESLAASLDRSHPDAAASLREGLAETLTVIELGLPAQLAATLRSTNPIESMIDNCRSVSRNVKRWRDGTMVLRWCAAGMLDAQSRFRRVRGYKHIPELIAALDRHCGLDTTRSVA